MSKEELKQLEVELLKHFKVINQEHIAIRKKLELFADGKKLKGDELVGWLGEIYCKLLLDGTLEKNDSLEYDLITKYGENISVKTRKGTSKGWNRTGDINKIEGGDCPTHLVFVHLNDNYSIDKLWKFPWNDLLGRFKEHKVRGRHRSFYFQVSPENDRKYLCYP